MDLGKWYNQLPEFWQALIQGLVGSAIIAVLAWLFRVPRRIRAAIKARGRRAQPLTTWQDFYAGPIKQQRFANQFVAVRRQKEGDLEVVAELEKALKGDADIIAICGAGGAGKSRALIELCQRHPELRFINTPAYQTDEAIGTLASALEASLKPNQVVIFDDLQNQPVLARRLREILVRTRGRVIAACRDPEQVAEMTRDRNLKTESIVLHRMTNVTEVVPATGAEADEIAAIASGIPGLAVLAKRHGNLHGIATGSDLLDSIVRDMAKEFGAKGLEVLAETAIRRGIAEDDPLYRDYEQSFLKVRRLGYLVEWQSDRRTFVRIDPDILSDFIAASYYFPQGIPSVKLREFLERVPVTEAPDVLTTLTILFREYRVKRAAEAARRLFEQLLAREEVSQSLWGKRSGTTPVESKVEPKVGPWTRMVLGMVITAYESFQLIEVVADLLDKVVEPALVLGDADILNRLGVVLRKTGGLDDALRCWLKAEELCAESGDRHGQARSLGNIGVVLGEKGELDRALEFYQKALKLAEEIGDKLVQVDTLGNIGVVLGQKGELDRALEYFQKGVAIYRELKNRKREAYTLGNIGVVLGQKGELDRALEYFQKELTIDRELENRQGEANTLSNIGMVWQAKGDWNQAVGCYLQALNIFRQLGAKPGVERTFGSLADCLAGLGQERFIGACMNAGMTRQEASELADRLSSGETTGGG